MTSSSSTPEGLEECLFSAEFWAQELPTYGQRMRNRADFYTVGAGLLGTLTSLAVWTPLVASKEWWAQGAVSAVALIAAAMALVPKQRDYRSCGKSATDAAKAYGKAISLIRVALTSGGDGTKAAAAESAFDAARKMKLDLDPYPTDLQARRNAKWERRHSHSKKAGTSAG